MANQTNVTIKRTCSTCGKTEVQTNGSPKWITTAFDDFEFCSEHCASSWAQRNPFATLGREHGEWSQTQFGLDSERGPEGPLAHLAKEVEEMAADPTDLSEYADGLLLLLDASRRAGFTADQLLEAASVKLKVNMEREWGEPNPDGSVEHIR